MDPGIGAKLEPLRDIQGSVTGTTVSDEWIRINHGRPNQGPSLFGSDINAQRRKFCFTAAFHVVQIKKDCKDAMTELAFEVVRSCVVVGIVKLRGE